jgi:hypothetical protein
MGWFSDFFSGGDWVGAAIGGAASVAGAVISSNANQAAAEKAAAGAQAQADAIKQGNALAQQRFEKVQGDTAGALQYQQETIAGANGLTPQQQAALEDTRRQTNNALAVSGLRGSGRAAVAAVRRTEADFTNNALDQNRRRADQAASSLSGQYFQAGNQAANTDVRSGMAQGQANFQTGMIGAEQGIADATQRGRAIGDIASIINDTAKEGRRSNYGATRSARPSESVDREPETMAG